MDQITVIESSELHKKIGDRKTSIIDASPVDAYNGWKAEGQSRGGHIQGARSLPVKWIKYIDWIEIVRSKNIEPDQEIIVYANNENDSAAVADRFLKSGFQNVKIYNGFVSEWCADERYPMDKLARYRQLVSPHWLASLINGESVPEIENKKYVVCHAHYRNRADYEKGHIHGSVEVDTNSLESPETWNRRSPKELKMRLEELGITADTTVVLYGRFAYPNNDDPFPGSSAGHLGSIRAAFIMMYAGVKDVRILNGGIQSWLDEGYDLTTEDTLPVAVSDCKLNIPERPELAVDVPEAKEMLASENAELVCVRSYPEFLGEVSGYNYIEKKGRIPGAVFGDCGTDAYHMENYRNLDHTCKEFNEISEAWARVGIVPEKHNAFYCGTGWRGSEAWLNAYLLGWPRVSVFDGGWFEWSNDPDNPFETGIPINEVKVQNEF